MFLYSGHSQLFHCQCCSCYIYHNSKQTKTKIVILFQTHALWHFDVTKELLVYNVFPLKIPLKNAVYLICAQVSLEWKELYRFYSGFSNENCPQIFRMDANTCSNGSLRSSCLNQLIVSVLSEVFNLYSKWERNIVSSH